MVALGCEGTFGSTSATIALAAAVRDLGRRGSRFSVRYMNYISGLQELLKTDNPARDRLMTLWREDFLAQTQEGDEFKALVANVSRHRLRQYIDQGLIMEKLRDGQQTDAAIAVQLHEMRRDWDRRHKEGRDDPTAGNNPPGLG